MARTSVAVPAGEVADRAADFPIIVGSSVTDLVQLTGGTPLKWVTGTAGVWPGTANTDPLFPVRRIADRRAGVRTRPLNAGTDHTLLIHLGTHVKEFDGIMIWDHLNLSSYTISFDLADNSLFTTDPQVGVATFSMGAAETQRLVQWDLNDTGGGGGGSQDRVTGAEFARITFAGGSSTRPEIGDIWLMRRRQFWARPRAPLDPSMERSVVNDLGPVENTSRYVSARGQRMIAWEWLTESQADVDLIQNLWRDSEEFSKRLTVFFNPTTLEREGLVMLAHPVLDRELFGPIAGVVDVGRTWRIEAIEQEQFFSNEVGP